MALKPTMFASSVQAVVACNVTAWRVCTLMFFIFSKFITNSLFYGDMSCFAKTLTKAFYAFRSLLLAVLCFTNGGTMVCYGYPIVMLCFHSQCYVSHCQVTQHGLLWYPNISLF